MNSEDYYKKLDNIVNDKSKFSEIKHDPQKPHPLIQKQNSVTYYINRYIKGHIAHRFFDQIIRTSWKKLRSLKNGFSIFSYKYGLVRPFEMVL